MIETLSVSISGTALSFLLYENMKSQYTQEGFLIGEIVEKEKKTITDNDQQQVHMERTIHISCAIPCPESHYFYDGIGRIDVDKIKTFFGDAANKIVAWYKYRRGISNICLTFRERIIHKQLCEFLKIPPEFFTCCLLMSDSSDNKSTHSYNQTFVRLCNNTLEEVPLHVINLSDSNNSYKSPEQVSATFSNILSELDINHDKTQGINIITQIQNALQKHTDSLVRELAEAEKRLFDLENEVRELDEENSASTNNNNEIMMETSSETVDTLNTSEEIASDIDDSSLRTKKRNIKKEPLKKQNVSAVTTRSRKKN